MIAPAVPDPRIAQRRSDLHSFEQIRAALRVALKYDSLNLDFHQAYAFVYRQIWLATADLCRLTGERISFD